jgi:hypothetical protein
MKMIKRMLALWLGVIIMFVLPGSKLARMEAEEYENDNFDRLIGVFVTNEYLDLFDYEKYYNDNMAKLFDGETILMNDSAYQGRLYAIVDAQNHNITFPGIEGTLYACAQFPTPETVNNFTALQTDEAISEGDTSVHVSDDEVTITMNGTIYASPDSSNVSMFPNPVYQSEDGRIYAMSGTGTFLGGDLIGSQVTQTVEKKVNITENGKSKNVNTVIKMTLAVMLPPESIAIAEMDKNNAVLSRTEHTPGMLPETLKPLSETEFLIVEVHKKNQEGKPEVSRTLYDKNSQTIETFYSREDGILIKQHTQIDWQK